MWPLTYRLVNSGPVTVACLSYFGFLPADRAPANILPSCNNLRRVAGDLQIQVLASNKPKNVGIVRK